MLLFVAVCFILLYWPVIVSFFASVKTGISIQLVAIVTFCFATRNTLLDFSANAQKEIGFPIRVGIFVRDLVCVMTGWYLPSSTWSCSVFWDVVLLVLVLFLINVELKLLNYCVLPLSEQKLFQPRHDACFFVTTKLCITPFISRWKNMLLLRPLSPGTVYAFC